MKMCKMGKCLTVSGRIDASKAQVRAQGVQYDREVYERLTTLAADDTEGSSTRQFKT
jgi:hypothetical protein